MWFCVVAVSSDAQAAFPPVHAIPQIVQPITLTSDVSHISLKGYFTKPSELDSVTCSKWLRASWDIKTNDVSIISQHDLKPLSELKLWSKGISYSLVLKKHMTDSALNDPNRPAIHTSKLGHGSFTVAVNSMRFSFSIVCYWQNFKLGKEYIKRAGDEILITLPEEAKQMDRSYIRVFASDEVEPANELIIPLDHGEVVNDPKQLAGVRNMGADSSYLHFFRGKQNKETTDKLSKLRSDLIALSYGETDYFAKDSVEMIRRSYFSQVVLFVFNRSKETKTVETGLKLDAFKANFGHTAKDTKVELPPSCFEVFTK